MKIIGTVDNDFLFGTDSPDAIRARAGDDYLYGGAGRDVLRGGPGADRFYFGWESEGFENDRILDFKSGQDDIRIGTGGGDGLFRPLIADEFHYGARKDRDDTDIAIYNPATGNLLIVTDDGLEKVAKLHKDAALVASDILI